MKNYLDYSRLRRKVLKNLTQKEITEQSDPVRKGRDRRADLQRFRDKPQDNFVYAAF